MKYSKQRLATAMAATMVVSMVPAMAFAAPVDVDNVVKELNKEDQKKATVGDTTSAEQVLAEAEKWVNKDLNAQKVVDAYKASIDVFKATDVADWTLKKEAFNKAVEALDFLNVDNSFKSAQTKMNHERVKGDLQASEDAKKVKEVEDLLKPLPEAATITDQAAADAIREKVKEASDKYDALTEAQKAKVDPALVAKLNALKAKVNTEFPNVDKMVVKTEAAPEIPGAFYMTVTSSDPSIVKVQAFEQDKSGPASLKGDLGKPVLVYLVTETPKFVVRGFDATDAQVAEQEAPSFK